MRGEQSKDSEQDTDAQDLTEAQRPHVPWQAAFAVVA